MDLVIFFPSLLAHKCSASCFHLPWLGNTKSWDVLWNKKHVFVPGLLQPHVSVYETACFTFLSALRMLFVCFNYKYCRIDNLSLCTSAWHLPCSFPCFWMFFHNSDNSVIHENEVSVKGKYMFLGDHVTYSYFYLKKGINSWFWKGDNYCGCSFEFGMDAGISWKKSPKYFWKIALSETWAWMGAIQRTAGLWWGDMTALEDGLSAFLSLHCCFSPLVDGVTGWELPTVVGVLRFCFSE